MPWLKSVGCGCGGCGPDPCTPQSAPAPTLQCDSVEASDNKDGNAEFAGYESTPPKYYRESIGAGSITQKIWEFNPGCTGTVTETIVTNFSGTYAGTLPAPCADVACVPSATATVKTYTGDGACYGTFPNHQHTGTGTLTLSDEFTTAQLIAQVAAALGGYPGTWAGDCTAYRNLTADEFTYTIRKFRYRFALPTLTGFTTYKITWTEGATAREYIWDGSATETGVYEVAVPGSNGTAGAITGITASCV